MSNWDPRNGGLAFSLQKVNHAKGTLKRFNLALAPNWCLRFPRDALKTKLSSLQAQTSVQDDDELLSDRRADFPAIPFEEIQRRGMVHRVIPSGPYQEQARMSLLSPKNLGVSCLTRFQTSRDTRTNPLSPRSTNPRRGRLKGEVEAHAIHVCGPFQKPCSHRCPF